MTLSSVNTIAPTTATITPGPLLHAKRDSATCGFISGNSAWPITCGSGYSCIATGSYTGERFACCDEAHCQNDWSNCQGYKQADLCGGRGTLCSFAYPSILTCGSALPYCVQYAFPQDLDAASTLFSLGCDSSTLGANILVLATPDAGFAGSSNSQGDADPSILDPGNTQSVAPSTASISANVPTASSISGGSGGFGGSTATTQEKDTHSVLSSAAIAGIVVAGIIILVLIAISTCCWRKWSNRRRDKIDSIQGYHGPGHVPIDPTVYSGETELVERPQCSSEWAARQYRATGRVPM